MTGGIASGKSEVARRLAARGAVVIDADELARRVVEPGTVGFAAVVARFGISVVRPDGGLDRARLGEIVFSDAAARAALNQIVHPLVRAAAADQERQAPVDAIVVHDSPLLVETRQQAAFDVIVVVAVSPEVQCARLMATRAMTAAEAAARISAQAPLGDKLAVAGIVIDNAGGLGELDDEVDRCWAELSRLSRNQSQQS